MSGDGLATPAAPPPAMPPAMPPSDPSPVEAALQAVEHTRRNLFPFRFERWLTLGLAAFLDQCGRSGVGANFPGGLPPIPGRGSGGASPRGTAAEALAALGAGTA